MALERCYALRCDSCGEFYTWLDSGCIIWCDTPRRARADAKRHGWHSPTVKYGNRRKDYCPTCADKQEDAG